MDQELRKRGWSIHSSDGDHHSDGYLRSRSMSGGSVAALGSRNRAESMASEPSMCEKDKLELLNSAFQDESGCVDEHEVAEQRSGKIAASSGSDGEEEEGEEEEGEEEEGEDFVAMFGDEGGDRGTNGVTSASVGTLDSMTRKRQQKRKESEPNKSDDDENSKDGNNKKGRKRRHVELTSKQVTQLDFAKTNLSKWAARLFDPNRPRGLVETPQVIPLNNEFLTAFGKREKEYDEEIGRDIHIDKTSLEGKTEEVDKTNDNPDAGEKKRMPDDVEKCKVKISNLAWATTTATIARICGKIGPVVDVNLIKDPERGQSTGRAYVVFESFETAEKAVEDMNEKTMEGRVVYVGLAKRAPFKKRQSSLGGRIGGGAQNSRYWVKELSMKCRRCDMVGHLEKKCPNGEKPKPCVLCAEVGHDSWTCPRKAVCFNCGVPGHLSRDCSRPRHMPKRVVCTICYQSGHHRWNCRERPWYESSRDATCMECGKIGHFMCSEMRWFFGLKGLTCFNCGGLDHHGDECKRPCLEVCAKNGEVGLKEIEMAEALALNEELSVQRMKSDPHSRGRSRNIDTIHGRDRAKSQPPPRDHHQSHNLRGGYHVRQPAHSPLPPVSNGRSYDYPAQDREHDRSYRNNHGYRH